MTPYYTEEQIRTEYREAANKPEQVKILAQLCDTDEDYIKAVVGLVDEVKEPKKREHKGKDIDYDKMDKMLSKAGYSLLEVSLFCGCSKTLVQKYCAKNISRYPHRDGRVGNPKWRKEEEE